nr:probably inactive leucine-rich repeat receptor-like protein kinase At5g48380 [Ipomoea batatas]
MLCRLVFALVHSFGAIHALQNDIDCLISIKASLEDPLGYLNTWNFDNNNTEGFICNFIGIECWAADENKVLNIRLSEMELKGQFPGGIEKCSSLMGLDLSGNQLYGAIPSDIGKMIEEVTLLDLSSNRFSDSYANNEGLCGGPLKPCKPVAHKDHSSEDFFISGFVAGWVVFMMLSLYIRLFGFPCSAANSIPIGKRVKVNSTSICSEQEDIDNNNDKILILDKFVSRISFMEMANATSSFRQENVVGFGSLGKVYKAALPNGLILAVKRLHKTQNLDEEFASEILTLSRLKHQNLVPILGARALDWGVRMKIAVGVAKALSWLHYSSGLNVVHNGLSSKCILLDQNFEPRISKFWEATIMNPNRTVSSSCNLLSKAAEYGDNFSPYTKDVYCFGIVLLQLITRKEAYKFMSCSTDIIFDSCTTSPLQIDEVIAHTGFDDSISGFLQIAKNCVKFMPNQRPTMLQSDIDCLKSVKESLEDPLGYLHSWNFNNKTEGFICSFIGVDCWHPDENKVLNIRLSKMELGGPFPLGIQRCSSLTGLDLSRNRLNGTIPSNITKIAGYLTKLDLSANQFSGEIPVGLANCTYLNVVKLDNNKLTGQIPPQFGLLTRIKDFSVANNRLIGAVPHFGNYSIPADNLANNEGLCGAPLPDCPVHAKKDHGDRDFFLTGFVTVVVLALDCCGGIHAIQSDIDCLKSVKESLEDPLGYLHSWNFNNKTEGFICSFTGVDCWRPDENKVLNIRLSDMELGGQFPLGIQRCSSLTALDLSSNKLNGAIPSNMTKIVPYLTTLDLSANQFSGEIPVDLTNCTFLNVLKLDNNKLTGQIPPQFGLLPRIKDFSVANNRLIGPVPYFGNYFPAENFANNEGLCGAPLPDCPVHAKKDHSHRDFFVTGFVTGWAIFVLITLFICLFGIPYAAAIGKNVRILKLEKYVSRMSFMEIANATSSFSPDNIVGCGTLGKVYKATLPNGWLLAIKRLHETENLDDEISKFWEAMITNPNDTASTWNNPVEYGDNFSPFTKDVYCFGIVLLQLITRKEAYELSCSTDIIFGSYTTDLLQIDEVITHTGFDDTISQFLEIAKNCVKFLPNQRPTMLQVYESLSSIPQPWVTDNASEISMDCT